MIRSLIGSFDFAPGMLPDVPLFSAVSSLLIWVPVGVLAILAVAGIVVWRTRRRWPVMAVLYQRIGRHPFAKYILLSVVAHIGLVIWLLSSSLLSPPPGPAAPPVFVQFGDEGHRHAQLQANRETSAPEDSSATSETKANPRPWEVSVADAVSPPQQELPDISPEPAKPVERKVAPPQKPSPRKQVPIPASLPEAAFAQQPSKPAAFSSTGQKTPVPRILPNALTNSLPPDLSTTASTNASNSTQPKVVTNQVSTSPSKATVNPPSPVAVPQNLTTNRQQFAATVEQPKANDVQRSSMPFRTQETTSSVETPNTRFPINQNTQATVNHQLEQSDQTPLVRSTPMRPISAMLRAV